MKKFPVTVVRPDSKLKNKIAELSKNMLNEQNIIAQRTSKKAEILAAKLIQLELGRTVTQKAIKESISRKQVQKGAYVVRFKKTSRIQLSKFGANQTRVGVTYKMMGERKVIPHAFMGNYPSKSYPPKLKGGAWKRTSAAPRSRIVQLFGPSPFGVLHPAMARGNNLWEDLRKQVGDEFTKVMLRRINSLIYKMSKG